MLNFPYLCRFCLIPKESSEFFGIFDAAHDISKKITELLNIQVVAGDGLPEEICLLCRDQLDISVTFKTQIERANTMLLAYLNEQNNQSIAEAPTITGDPLNEEQCLRMKQEIKETSHTESDTFDNEELPSKTNQSIAEAATITGDPLNEEKCLGKEIKETSYTESDTFDNEKLPSEEEVSIEKMEEEKKTMVIDSWQTYWPPSSKQKIKRTLILLSQSRQARSSIRITIKCTGCADVSSLREIYNSNLTKFTKWFNRDEVNFKLAIQNGGIIIKDFRELRKKGITHCAYEDFKICLETNKNKVKHGDLTINHWYACIHRFISDQILSSVLKEAWTPCSPLVATVVFEKTNLASIKYLLGTGLEYQAKYERDSLQKDWNAAKYANFIVGAMILDFKAEKHHNNPNKERQALLKDMTFKEYYEGYHAGKGKTLVEMLRNLEDENLENFAAMHESSSILSELVNSIEFDDSKSGSSNRTQAGIRQLHDSILKCIEKRKDLNK